MTVTNHPTPAEAAAAEADALLNVTRISIPGEPDVILGETATEEGDENEVEEMWAYMGLRQAGGKLVQSWLDPRGEEHTFANKRGGAVRLIGSSYTVDWDAQTKTARLGRERLSLIPKHPDAKTAYSARGLEKRLADNTRLDANLDELADAYDKIRSYDDKAGFLKYVTARITRGPRDR
jgi:hypothetical protein